MGRSGQEWEWSDIDRSGQEWEWSGINRSHKVVWRREKDLHPLTIGMFTFVPDERISVDYNQRTNEWSLIIHNVNPADEATYNCQISTKDSNTRSYKIKLNVKTVQVTGTEYVERGNALHLVCNASGKPDPPHDVQWFKGGERLQSDASRSILITKKIETKALISVLVIQKSQMADAGDYSCRSSNKDTGTLRVHILNVASSQIKRGTKKASSVNSRANLHHISGVTLIVTLWLGHWWHRA
ncbi:hypothetical protein NP493_379g00015 [Ridgeia piscesae]|uniref:Ig-like domain-containing protein n=1 Tax=Ridgeia piscesae TaxID=27915 RepID=A0AAD9L2Y7_RIDPI|nr:hypothetical protein NP493_379g00015 [Ridgeia piscesae]